MTLTTQDQKGRGQDLGFEANKFLVLNRTRKTQIESKRNNFKNLNNKDFQFELEKRKSSVSLSEPRARKGGTWSPSTLKDGHILTPST